MQEHTNPEFKPTLGNYLRFLSFMLKNGLSFGTCREIATQLLKERVSDIRWKRPFILDSLQWDVFSSHYRREKPDFATFFSNSVAHTQHTHWREFEPSAFDVKPTEDEIQKFGNAVRAAYEANDRIVGKALSLIDDDTTLVFCTALSQRPAVEWEAEGGKTFYRPFDMEKFCRFLGVPGDFKCRPVMSEEFWIELEEGTALQTAVDILDGATVGDRKLMKTFVRDGGVYTGCGLHSALPEDTEFTTHDGRTATIGEFLYKSDDVKSGAHDPNGMLWICTPKREHEDVAQEDVPLESIAPTILRLLNIKVPDSMTAAPLPRVFQ